MIVRKLTTVDQPLTLRLRLLVRLGELRRNRPILCPRKASGADTQASQSILDFRF